MPSPRALIVDDERNMRLTLARALETIGLDAVEAADAETGLEALTAPDIGVVLLDLRMPGMGGMEFLRRVRELRPDVPVVIITAHGTIDLAVDAMRLGAVDFIQKPFSPDQIRQLVSSVLDREAIDARRTGDYAAHLSLAKRCISQLQFDAAMAHAGSAIALDSGRPEAFNLMGAIHELRHDMAEAQNNYRAALALDPTYAPAMQNLKRTGQFPPRGAIALGPD